MSFKEKFYKEASLTFWAEERAALSAEEVFRMPCPIQRRHNFLHKQETNIYYHLTGNYSTTDMTTRVNIRELTSSMGPLQ